MNGCIILFDHSDDHYHEPLWLGESVIRDKRGRPHKKGYTRFARVVCNNSECTYEALVNVETVARAVAGT